MLLSTVMIDELILKSIFLIYSDTYLHDINSDNDINDLPNICSLIVYTAAVTALYIFKFGIFN